jgi:cytochrome c-type biogenesis protein CcmH/NrfG
MSARIPELLDKVARNPRDTLTRYVLAKDYFDAGEHGRAAAEFEELLRQKPDWMKCWIHLGQSRIALGQVERAREALGKALELARAQHHLGPAAEVEELLAALG